MFTKNLINLLAVAALANQAMAIAPRHHAHSHAHQQKRELQTAYTTVVKMETVFVWDDDNGVPTATSTEGVEPSSTASLSSSSLSSSSSSSLHSTLSTTTTTSLTSFSTIPKPTTSSLTTIVPPVPSTTSDTQVAAPTTTLATSVVTSAAASSPANNNVEVKTSAVKTSAAPATTSAAPVVSTSGRKRGLVYNDPTLLPGFVGTGSKISWGYNWGQTNDMKVSGVEFVPMLWGTGSNHVNSWTTNANKAISGGSKCLLSFNEPDNAGQSNLSPAAAKAGHIQYMNPYSGKARIGAPAITNSGAADQGIGWMTSFLSVCAGECAVDFIPVHWYAPATAISYFYSFLLQAHAAFPGKPIWITEFAPSGTDAQIDTFVKTVMDQLDNNATFSFVERYGYFMVSQGRLISSGTTLSTYGNTYAYA